MGTCKPCVPLLVKTVPFCLVHAAALCTSEVAVAQISPDDGANALEAAINAAAPGDEIVVGGGMYTLSERFSFDIAGTEDAPIVIRAADGQTPHLHRPDANQNIIDVDGASWVVLRGIELSGGSAGIRVSTASHLTIEACHVHDTGDVAVRFNDTGGTYEDIRILGNHIHHTSGTGEGMYLGCNNDGCRLANSLIAGNYIHDTNQATVEQGDGIEMKEGGFGNVFRDNVIHGTNYPCMLVDSAVGNGPVNVVERNLLWDCGDHGLQISGQVVVRNNVILSAASDGIALQAHQNGVPSGVFILNNTVIHAAGRAVTVRDAAGEVVIANNALYGTDAGIWVGGGDTSELVLAANAGVGGVQGVMAEWIAGDIATDFVSASYDGAPPMDVFPTAAGVLVGAGDATWQDQVPDDFNGTARAAVPDIGAYAFSADGNPGWALAAALKGGATTTPPEGFGMGGAGAGGAAGATGAGGNPPGNPYTGGAAGNANADPQQLAGQGTAPDAPAGDAGQDSGCAWSGRGPSGHGPAESTVWVAVAAVLLSRRRRES